MRFKQSVELHFSRQPRVHVKKLEYRMHQSGRDEHWTAFSKASGGSSDRVFPESRAPKALWLALLRLKAQDASVSAGRALLIGKHKSPAFALAQIIIHPDRSVWSKAVFEPSFSALQAGFPNGVSVLRGLFLAVNPNLENETEPVRIFPGTGDYALQSKDIRIFVDDHLASLEEVAAIERALSSALQENPNRPLVSGNLSVSDSLLVGREPKIMTIENAARSGIVRLVQIQAPGGFGKTGLADAWLKRTLNHEEVPYDCIYIWPFYQQGFSGHAVQSMWPFRDGLAQLLNVSIPRNATAGETAKILRDGMEQKRILLIFDGIEAALHPPGTLRAGHFKDDVLPLLFEAILQIPSVFCVVSTRQLVELPKFTDPKTTETMELGPLDHDDCRRLLKQLGVSGTPRDLESAVQFTEGRPLLIRLLAGIYCRQMFLGLDALRAVVRELEAARGSSDRFRRLDDATVRTMRVHLKWLAGTPELALLRLGCLFDRVPDELAVWELLRDPAAVGGLIEGFTTFREERWRFVAENLRRYQLVNEGQGLSIVVHPVTQSFFAEHTKREIPDGWKAGHRILYEYYRHLPEKELPDTSLEMAPLLIACCHGCWAGDYQRTYDEVALPRISRGIQSYLLRQLGGIHEAISMASTFCEDGWNFPASSDLSDEAKGAFLLAVSNCYRLRDELPEAISLLKRAESHLKKA